MTGVGLHPVIRAAAEAAYHASRGRNDAETTIRRIHAAIEPHIAEAVEIGLDQGLIALDDRKRALRRKD